MVVSIMCANPIGDYGVERLHQRGSAEKGHEPHQQLVQKVRLIIHCGMIVSVMYVNPTHSWVNDEVDQLSCMMIVISHGY